MSNAGRWPAARVLAAARGVADLALVARPDVVLTALAVPAPRPPDWLVRALGVRVVIQEIAVLRSPTRRLVLGGAAVDGLHAASMVLAALALPQHRRAAAISATAATASALLGLAGAPAARPAPEFRHRADGSLAR